MTRVTSTAPIINNSYPWPRSSSLSAYLFGVVSVFKCYLFVVYVLKCYMLCFLHDYSTYFNTQVPLKFSFWWELEKWSRLRALASLSEGLSLVFKNIKRESKERKCSHQTGLQESLWGLFLINIADVGGPRTLLLMLSLHRPSWEVYVSLTWTWRTSQQTAILHGLSFSSCLHVPFLSSFGDLPRRRSMSWLL